MWDMWDEVEVRRCVKLGCYIINDRKSNAQLSKMLSKKQRKNEKKQQRRNTNMNKKKAYWK